MANISRKISLKITWSLIITLLLLDQARNCFHSTQFQDFFPLFPQFPFWLWKSTLHWPPLFNKGQFSFIMYMFYYPIHLQCTTILWLFVQSLHHISCACPVLVKILHYHGYVETSFSLIGRTSARMHDHMWLSCKIHHLNTTYYHSLHYLNPTFDLCPLTPDLKPLYLQPLCDSSYPLPLVCILIY